MYIMAAPSNCLYRCFNSIDNNLAMQYSTKISMDFIGFFNTRIAKSILKLYVEGKSFWLKTLKYCYAGNFQAMMDEFFYVINKKGYIRLCKTNATFCIIKCFL